MLNIRSVLEMCILLSIIMAPFDGLNIYGIGLFQRGWIIPSIIGIVIFFLTIRRRQIYITKTNKIFLLFILYMLLVSILNLDNIIGVEFKGRSAQANLIGEYRFLIIIFLVLIYYTDILLKKKNMVEWIYKGIKYSFFIVILFSFIQILAMMDISSAKDTVLSIEHYINVQTAVRLDDKSDVDFLLQRIHGVSLEPSTFSNYIMVIFPWLCMGAFYFDKKLISKILPLIAIILVLLSYSRIGYVFLLMEIFIIGCWFNKVRKYIFSFKSLIFFIILIGVIFLYVDVDTISEKSTSVILSLLGEAEGGNLKSNITRAGLQYAAFSMFLSNPLIGVGLGQFQFNVVDYLPAWSYLSVEIQGVAQSGNPKYFMGTFNTHLRVLAESGIIGGILWISIAWKGLRNYLFLLKHTKNDRDNKRDIIKFLFISYVAAFLGFINFDTYLSLYYWMLLIISEVYIYKIKYQFSNKKL